MTNKIIQRAYEILEVTSKKNTKTKKMPTLWKRNQAGIKNGY